MLTFFLPKVWTATDILKDWRKERELGEGEKKEWVEGSEFCSVKASLRCGEVR